MSIKEEEVKKLEAFEEVKNGEHQWWNTRERIVRIGSNETIKIDVRIIAATNKDLGALVKEGKFREDLYFRFNVICLRLPPLRERQEDVFLLIDTFIKEFSKKNGKKIKEITPEARKILFRYNWPGNVRELKNCIESMIVFDQMEYLI